jgi:carboxyl-terminal processing protease
MTSKKFTNAFLTISAIVLSFIIGVQIAHARPEWFGWKQDGTSFDHPKTAEGIEVDFSPLWDVWQMAELKHVDRPLDEKEMLYGAINGMLYFGLQDQFSAFFPPNESEVYEEDLSGRFGGVGVEMDISDGNLVVVAPLDDSPAQEGGIMAGDWIVKIDGESTDTLTINEAVQKIRGDIGTTVVLTIMHKDETTTQDITLERALIDVESVTWEQKDNQIAYIQLNKFAGDTTDEWNRVIDEVITWKAKGIVLDVRNNSGGYIERARDIVSEFVQSGEVVVIEDEGDGNKTYVRAIEGGELLNIPLVVLVNGGSASSSEIVAGALQDYERATLIGEQTFGKGVMQETMNIELPDESQPGTLQLTTGKWYTPKERWIHKTGLTPDIEVELTADDYKADKDPQLDRAIEELINQ